MPNRLYYGDNLDVLRRHMRDESIDLIYLDPPFNSAATYNMLFQSPDGLTSPAQRKAFEDTWHWTDEAESAFDDVMQSSSTRAAELLRALRECLGENDLTAYLAMLTVRLIEMHRALKSTGSLYLHCDPTASHYIKILMDGIFGPKNFRSEIVWKRTSGHVDSKRYGPVHDTILFYGKSEKIVWNDIFQAYDKGYIEQYYRYKDDKGRRFMSGDLSAAGLQGGGYNYEWKGITRVWRVPVKTMERYEIEGRIFYTRNGIPRVKRYLDESKGLPAQDVWADIEALRSWHKERLGYPTQKPVALLERIIAASSLPGQTVLDPFCGCGTAVHAAQALNRRWIGIDITHLAVDLIERRLRQAFGDNAHFSIIGTPVDLDGAKSLAAHDKHEFQLWAIAQIKGVPFQGGKKGADGGIDGLIYFKPDGKKTERAIISVKGGENVGVIMIRDLAHVVERERAKIGVFLTLAPATKPMQTEAYRAGFYETEHGRHLRIQIISVADLFRGRKADIPMLDNSAYRSTLEHMPVQESFLI